MSKVKMIGNSAVVVSAHKLEDLLKLERYAQNGLVLKDKDTKEEQFRIGFDNPAQLSD